MKTTFSGTYIGTPGSHSIAAGSGLELTSHTANYTLTSLGIADGGAGYSFPQFSAYTGSGSGGAGGIGVNLTTGGSLTNYGNIAGGGGGQGATSTSGKGNGGAGGIGIRFAASGTLINHGVADGGQGARSGYGNNASGAGGIAVDFIASGSVINDSQITGGAGGSYGQLANDGIGGDGIFFGAKSTLANNGTITGGAGGYGGLPNGDSGAGGDGVQLSAGGLVINTAIVSGGNGGFAYNNISSGLGTRSSNAGGSGIDLAKSGIVLNSGTINGGTGGGGIVASQYLSNAGNGGDGIDAASGSIIINSGNIAGGQAGTGSDGPYPSNNFGGAGVSLSNGLLLNFGVISGGGGGYNAGDGAAGVEITGGAIPAINFGTITGGNGGPGDGFSGLGGDGVVLTKAGSFINLGTIVGGSGRYGPAGSSGTGIELAGGSTLIDAGYIGSGEGYAGNAVYFSGAGSSRLIVNAAATLAGAVTATGSGNVLELVGNDGTIFDDADEINGFQTLQIDSHASWAVAGTFANLLNQGVAEIANGESLDITSAVNSASAGSFELAGNASLDIAALLGSHVQINFLGGTPENMLTIDDPAKFGLHVGTSIYAGPLLEDFKAGNSIDLKGIGSSGLKFEYNTTTGNLQITASGGGVVATLQFQNASLGAGSFHLATDNAGGSLLTHS